MRRARDYLHTEIWGWCLTMRKSWGLTFAVKASALESLPWLGLGESGVSRHSPRKEGEKRSKQFGRLSESNRPAMRGQPAGGNWGSWWKTGPHPGEYDGVVREEYIVPGPISTPFLLSRKRESKSRSNRMCGRVVAMTGYFTVVEIDCQTTSPR